MTDPLRPGADPNLDADATSVTPTPAPGSAVPPPAPTTDRPTTAEPLTPSPVLQPATQPAAATAAGRSSRVRWVAAAAIVALVVGASALATLALTGASSKATVLGYVPADSLAYAEVRLDLPGDQRRQVGEFLSAFPGFADQAALDTKLDEVLDRVVSEESDGTQTFTADIKPWFDGELALAVGPLPDSAPTGDSDDKARGHGLALISIKDEAAARAWFTKVFGDAGLTGQTQTHEGTEMTVFSDASVANAEAAVAIVDGRVAIAGDRASVEAAIEAGGNSAFANDADLKAAMDAMDGDHVGFAFIDIDAITQQALEMAGPKASALPVAASLAELVPDWAAGRLRVEGDALVIDGVTPHVDGAPGPDENDANGVAGFAPPSTVVLAAANDYGATLLETVDRYRQDPDLGEVFEHIDGAANILGGLDAALGWMGDTGIVIADGDGALEGGLVSIPSDATGAQQLLTTLRSFATLAGGQAGVKVTDETYNTTTITIIDLGSVGELAGMAGALGGGAVPSVPPSTDLPDDPVRIAYAATPDVVVIGSGPDFVKAVLDAGAGESLADTGRYRDLVGRVGAEHTGVAFVDVAALRGVLEGLMADASAEDRAEYQESIQPFLTPFDAVVAATTTGDLDEQHAIITVK